MSPNQRWRGVGVEALDGLFCRAVRDAYSPLDASGALLFGGRFNPRGTAAIYLAKDPDLAMRESTRSCDWAGFRAFAPRQVVCVRVKLSRAVDLTVADNARTLELSAHDFSAQWTDLGDDCPTQALGHIAAADGIEGLLFPSRADPGRPNLVVFRDNMRAGSRLEVIDSDDAG
jgi:RES domain-containing protein